MEPDRHPDSVAGAPQLCTPDVELQGLFDLLGHHLYSTPAVVVRELVQNAADSIVRRRLAEPSYRGGTITLLPDAAQSVLVVEDDGAGLSADEIVRDLATIGRGGTRDVREAVGSDELIGLFGIGFLSAFVVAHTVTLTTTSWRAPEQGWQYRSVGGQRYTLQQVAPRSPGTTVTLELRSESAPLADLDALATVAGRYTALLPLPVRVGRDSEPVNATLPPWRAPTVDGIDEHPVQARRARLAFASLFEPAFKPLCTMDVTPVGPSDAWGLLWVQDGATYGSSDNRCVSLFSRGMLVVDDARHLLPRWAGFCGAVVESARVSPTASREDVRHDEAWHAVRLAVAEQLIRGLADVARLQPATWRRVTARHNEALLGAALADPRLFDLLAETLTVPTTAGDLTVAETFERGGGALHVTHLQRGGFEEMVCRVKGIPVALGARYAVLPFVRRWATRHDAPMVELGTVSGDSRLFRPVTVDRPTLARLTALVGGADEELVTARFEPTSLPLVPVRDRESELKRRLETDEADERIGSAVLALARLHTATVPHRPAIRLYVNMANPAVRLLATRPEGAGTEDALRLLRVVKQLIAGSGPGFVDAAGAPPTPDFDALTGVLCRLLDGAGEKR